ncbi:MAG TPA: LuxR C-terminal-related transcriptional regulator [Allosphingosinicella sp.]|jgi:DNA-binding CsgD family transcriptional regulator/catechol 2,3-dioxygenase-like lactoylglutathione lyase family enzyme
MALKRLRGRPPHADILTPAEWRVVEAVRHGMSNPQIARRQGVSLDAVKYHVANALLKLGLASRVELRRWDGVREGSTLKRSRKETAMSADANPTGLVQICRTTADLEAAKGFYGETLGLLLLYAFPGMAFFQLGEVRLYLQEMDEAAPESILYLRVDDIHAAHRNLADKGVAFFNAPHLLHRHPDGTEEWMAEFRDNEGRPLALMCRAEALAVT